MIKLYIRNYFLLVIVLGVIIVSIYVFVLSLNQGVVNKNAQVITDGTFNYLEESLKKIPKNQWQNYIDQLQKNNLVQKIQIVSYKNLPQQIKDNPALGKGQTASYLPLNLLSSDNIYQGHSAYRRINKSKYYFKIEMIPPVIFQYQYNTQWMKITIDQLFAQKKFEDYEKIAQKATKYFGVPVIVSKFSNLTEEAQKNLLKWHVLAISYDDSHSNEAKIICVSHAALNS